MKAKDMVYLGIGVAFLAKDKLKERFKEWEERGERNKDDTKKFMQDAKDRAKKEQEDFDSHIKEKFKETIRELGVATKEDLEELKTMIKKA
jgi:polyhydroxyalkanoate synthesis regulator phasin